MSPHSSRAPGEDFGMLQPHSLLWGGAEPGGTGTGKEPLACKSLCRAPWLAMHKEAKARVGFGRTGERRGWQPGTKGGP